MNKIHIFDIDNTITPARQKMELNFSVYFEKFCRSNKVALVTGSTLEMIKEQVPEEILDLCSVYTCAGIEGISFDVDYAINDSHLINELSSIIEKANYSIKTGNHINLRKGMINFSVVGRNADLYQRAKYNEYDKLNLDRHKIIQDLSKKFPNYEYYMGGEISIDIARKGINKSLVGQDLLKLYPDVFLVFYGDGIIDGNDYPLAKYIKDNQCGYSIQIDYQHLKSKFYDYIRRTDFTMEP